MSCMCQINSVKVFQHFIAKSHKSCWILLARFKSQLILIFSAGSPVPTLPSRRYDSPPHLPLANSCNQTWYSNIPNREQKLQTCLWKRVKMFQYWRYTTEWSRMSERWTSHALQVRKMRWPLQNSKRLHVLHQYYLQYL